MVEIAAHINVALLDCGVYQTMYPYTEQERELDADDPMPMAATKIDGDEDGNDTFSPAHSGSRLSVVFYK